MYPDHTAALNNLAYLLAERENRAAEAVPYIEKAARLDPTNVDILDSQGFIYSRTGNHTQAEVVLVEAIRLDRKAVAPHLHLGQLHALLGRTADARREFQTVIELTSDQKNHPYRKTAEEELSKLR